MRIEPKVFISIVPSFRVSKAKDCDFRRSVLSFAEKRSEVCVCHCCGRKPGIRPAERDSDFDECKCEKCLFISMDARQSLRLPLITVIAPGNQKHFRQNPMFP